VKPMRVSVEVVGDAAEEVTPWLVHALGSLDMLDPHIRRPFAEGGGMVEVETEGPNRFMAKPDPAFSLLVKADEQEDELVICSVAVHLRPFYTVFHRMDVIDRDEFSSLCEGIARDLCFTEGGARWFNEYRESLAEACGLPRQAFAEI